MTTARDRPLTPRNRIDDAELARLFVVERLTQAEIARRFGVRPPSVTRRLQRLGFPPRKPGPAPGSLSTTNAHRALAERGLFDVAQVLQQLHDELQDELAFLRRRAQQGGDDERVRLIESKLVPVLSELRKLVHSAVDVQRAAYALSEAKRFRELVLGVLERADPALKREVLRQLAEARADHRALAEPGFATRAKA